MLRKRKIFLIFLIFLFVVISLNFSYDTFVLLENDIVITKNEFEEILGKNLFVSSEIMPVSKLANNDNIDEYIVEYRLFDLFTIKRLKVNVIEPDRYFAGGDSLGFSLQSKGVVLIGGNYILSESGIKKPYEDSGLKTGDIITHIDNVEINSVQDISDFLKNYIDGEIKLTIIRNGESISVGILPALDKMSGTYKLGLWVKEDAVGIGTLTFVNATTGRYGALGHCINDNTSEECLEVSGGNIYNARILGVKKGSAGRAGELIGTFNREDVIGSVDKNCEYGVYGYIDKTNNILNGKTSIEIGGRLSAKPGKAKILSCIDGENIEEFDIEIIKTNFQSSSNQKSMVLREVDKDLISRTGGIVQGMSGSPIIQDGKLIGAVTHVFVNDATKGFGLYIDWMLEQ
jgi:stage IV sporulation protein B